VVVAVAVVVVVVVVAVATQSSTHFSPVTDNPRALDLRISAF